MKIYAVNKKLQLNVMKPYGHYKTVSTSTLFMNVE